MEFVGRTAVFGAEVLTDATQAEDHISGICFKTGPPRRLGAELEFTVHRAGEPAEYLDLTTLRRALGAYAPTSLDHRNPPVPLPGGGIVTAEPGGQLEISSATADSLPGLYAAVTADLTHLTSLLADAGLTLGDHGIDPYRAPRRLLDTPRYAAMERTLDRHGPYGRTMMCSTAGLQICLDAGTKGQVAARFATVSALGPVLIAAFANSARHAGRDTGWASARMGTWLRMDPRRAGPVDPAGGAAANWAAYALAAPLLCVRGDGECWDPPPGVTFADWIGGALDRPPTLDDLDYHLSTLFPPVRPRGYLEVRYLDTQAGGDWIAPAAVLTALLADDDTAVAAYEMAWPVSDAWLTAARVGLADPDLRDAATGVLDLACHRLDRTGLAPDVRDHVTDLIQARLRPHTDRAEGKHR
jgi:glutamate--cysteine ligase